VLPRPLPIVEVPVLRFSAFATERCDRPFAFPTLVRFFFASLASRETLFGLGDAFRDLLVFMLLLPVQVPAVSTFYVRSVLSNQAADCSASRLLP
jgi:hypothetical protein